MEKSKLPAKQTTKHVTKPQYQEGQINHSGEMKTIDNQTGKAKWIDAKKGLALDINGDPTHERY